MDNMQKIELIRTKADITYKTACEILEGVNWDVDAAETALKKEGIYREETTAMTTTDFNKETNERNNAEGFKGAVKKAFHWTGDKFRRGMHNDFIITSKSGKSFSLPVTLAVIFTIAGIEIIPLALIIAFFCGCRFSFSGPDLGSSKINEEMSNIRYSYNGK